MGERLSIISVFSTVAILFPVVSGGKVYILDLAAKLDQCAEYLCKQTWGDIEFPPPFGREAFPEVCGRRGKKLILICIFCWLGN